jgi:asparagine synthase (glutamine-hydrolysing)
VSAIFGLVHWDGRLVAAGELARMDAALAAHGPDGGDTWRDGSVGLGHRLSWVTPEDRFERQPIQCSGGQGVLVADARIDNRDELARAGVADHEETRDWPDSAFVARALETWGDEAAGRLRGPFALAHWDRRSGRLLLARSPFSERPLFYHSSPRTFAFASMPKGLFALGVVDRAIDEQFLADFLALERFDPDATFYRDVRRLPAGHALAVTSTGARSWPFWRPDLIPELRLPTDEAYVEAFNEIYARAIRDALRSDGPVGLMLSGGLDSSSVAATAAPLLRAQGRRLAAFTEVPPPGASAAAIPGRYADETPFVESVARRYDNIDLTLIRPDGRFLLHDADRRYDTSELLTKGASNLVWWDALMETARSHGVRVLLHGTAGNQTVSWTGSGALCRMIGQGRWRDAIVEARAIGRVNGGRSALRTLASQGVLPWLPTSLYLGIQTLMSPGTAHRHPWRAWSPINPVFEAAHRVRARALGRGHDDRLRVQPDTRAMRYGFLHRAGERSDGLFAGCQARFGLEARDPTADRRLVEFCLSLPEDQYERHGRTRWLIRRAMADRLPVEILDNPRRGLQAANWFAPMLQHRHRMFDELAQFEQSELARRAIDLQKLRRLIDAMPSADAAAAETARDYRGVLELGLAAGRFILWAEAAGPGASRL